MKTKKQVSQTIIQRIKENQGCYFANCNISQYIHAEELPLLLEEVQQQVEALLQTLVIDTQNDSHTQETSARIAKMLLFEVMKGRYQPLPRIKTFENQEKYHDLILLGPIQVNSMCSHHFVPVIGELYLGIIADEKIWGISKFSRICNWFLRRPHIQENATQELAQLIDELLKPKGLIIHLTATHFCMTWRGVHERDFKMTTIAKTGVFNQSDNEHKFYEMLALKQG